MVWVRGRRVVLERLVVGDVVVLVSIVRRTGGGSAGAAQCRTDRMHRIAQPLIGRRGHRELALELVRGERARRLRAAGGRRREGGGWPETTLEPAPAEAGRIEVVADIRTCQRDGVPGRAVVVVRLGIGHCLLYTSDAAD